MASGDFFNSYSSIAQWPGALPLILETRVRFPVSTRPLFLCVLFLLLLVVVLGAASIMMLVVTSGGVDDEIGRSRAHDEIGGEIGDEISDEIRRALVR